MILASMITFDSMEQILGAKILELFGGREEGIFLLGLFFIIMIAIFVIKQGVGFEAAFIFVGYALYLATAGMAGQGGILPLMFLTFFVLICGYIIFLAFIKRDM
jgi:hypothetical protein